MTIYTDPKIYVADLAVYNGGHLHGVWIEVTEDQDDIQEQIQLMLKDSPVEDAEEWAIHDFEGFDSAVISKYEGIERVVNIAMFLNEYSDIGGALVSHVCGDLDESHNAAEEQYHGCYRSLADHAQEITEETSQIPKHLEFYIDYDRMGRDMEMSGDVSTIEAGHDQVHIFWGH